MKKKKIKKKSIKKKKKSKKKKKIIERNGSKILSSNRSLLANFSTLFFPLLWKNWISSPVFVTTTNDTRRSKSTHDIYNKKELSIISRSNKMMLMCVNRCVIHFSTFR